MKEIKILIPIYNEEESILFLKNRILNVINEIKKYSFKILFIDDGSTDGSIDIVNEIRKIDSRFEYISFSRNFGKETAIIAGLDYSKNSDAVIIMDADLQDPPELIPQMIEEWENGCNRTFNIQPLMRGETYFPMETEVFFNLPERKIAGSAIPVFSLRSKGSFGVGDFGDLKTYIDWAADTNQQAVQILPINDTTITNTWTDSYPYNSISIYAFHPMFIDLRQLPALKDSKKATEYEKERVKLNSLSQVDYEGVNNTKRAYLKDIFAQEAENILSSEDFKTFYCKNEEWLKPYSAFSYLRDLYGTADFNTWPEYSTYVSEEIDKLCDKEAETYPEISFYYFLQYVLHVQLLAAANHARSKDRNDPFGSDRHTHPHLCNRGGHCTLAC